MSKYLMNNCTGEERTEDDRTVRKVLYTYDRVGRLVRKEVVRNLTDMFRRKQERPCAGRSRSRSCIIMEKGKGDVQQAQRGV